MGVHVALVASQRQKSELFALYSWDPPAPRGSGILPLGFEQWPSHNGSAWISLFSVVQAQKDGIRVGFKEVNNFPPQDLRKMVQTWYGTSLSGI